VPVQIDLTPEQLERAKVEAYRRQAHNEAKALKGRNRAPASGEAALKMHELGCIGELAVAAYLGLEDSVFSNETPLRGSCDLPGGIEVKTRPKHGRDLLVQLDDDPGKVFVLVTHEGTTKVAGWAKGVDIMKREYVRELVKGRPCYVVSQKVLQPAETLESLGLASGGERILGAHEVWTAERENGDVVLNFSDDLVAQLGWQVGDVLKWDTRGPGEGCVITKRS
jgi:hypothetical protein